MSSFPQWRESLLMHIILMQLAWPLLGTTPALLHSPLLQGHLFTEIRDEPFPVMNYILHGYIHSLVRLNWRICHITNFSEDRYLKRYNSWASKSSFCFYDKSKWTWCARSSNAIAMDLDALEPPLQVSNLCDEFHILSTAMLLVGWHVLLHFLSRVTADITRS